MADQIARAPVRDVLRVIPVKNIALRVSKFDVVLRQAPLRAAQVMHTILTRMLMFRCLLRIERFPTGHPAYVPPEKVGMHLLKKGGHGVAQCTVEVASWTEFPPFVDDVDGIAKRYTGTCLCCQKDMDSQKDKKSPSGEEITPVPTRSFLNVMDPNWNFPR